MRLYVVDGDDPGVAVPPKRDTEFRARARTRLTR